MSVNQTGIDLTPVIESTAEGIWNDLPGDREEWSKLDPITKAVLRERVLGVVKYAVDPIAKAVRSKDSADVGIGAWDDDAANKFFFGTN